MIDLDNFKYINSSYGQEIRDLFIKSVSEILTNILPSSTIIGRIGGDKFAVVVYDIET
ncbi:MAG: GGDEF domain-containing protein [Hydrogenothermaceae bacterium]|nr:GGDEF domain-containing protein [Hydrogenothermaceae bacterium]